MAQQEHALMTATEVAAAFNVDVNTVYKTARRGGMPFVKFGNNYRFPRWWVEKELRNVFAISGPGDYS
jgi:excisionase family DNA binding protein